MRIFEVCCGSYSDCMHAYYGGAKRVELNSALAVGGLSPTLATLLKVKQDTDLKVICMVRPRAGGFCYTVEEKDVMMKDAQIFMENGADGIAFGFLNADRSIQKEYTKQMVDLIHSYKGEAVFHRAFDVTDDPLEAMEELVSLHVDRVLTSGQKAKAMNGKECIRTLQERFSNEIEILAGSGMNASNAVEMMEYTGIEQIHSSCKAFETDPTTKGRDVSFAYLETPDENAYDVVDEELVKKLAEVMKE